MAILCLSKGPSASKTLWSAIHMQYGDSIYGDSARVALTYFSQHACMGKDPPHTRPCIENDSSISILLCYLHSLNHMYFSLSSHIQVPYNQIS